MKPYLTTQRIIMRELTSSDEDALFDLDSDPDVMKYLTNGIPSSREEVQSAVSRVEKLLQKHSGRFGFWLSFEKSTGEFKIV